MPRKTPVECQCQQCHQTFEAMDYRATRPPKFCSRACRDDARRTKVELTCRHCGSTFLRKAYQETWSQERGPFCSMPCYGAWQREHIQGPSSPSWGLETNPHGWGSHRWLRNRVDGEKAAGVGLGADFDARLLSAHELRQSCSIGLHFYFR